jgi:hypothetical protein
MMIKKTILLLFVTAGLIVPFSLSTTSTLAVSVAPICDGTAKNTEVCKEVKTQERQKNNPIIDTMRVFLNILSLIVGIAAVILLVVSGLKMVMSGGDPAAVKSSRDGIINSLIGLAVTLLAQSIVVFVLDKV